MANPAIAPQELTLEERIKLDGATHRITIDYTDLTDTAGTAKTLAVLPYQARDILRLKGWDAATLFDGGSTSDLTIKLGHNGATIDDDDSLLEAVSCHADGTYFVGGAAKSAADTVDQTFATPEATVVNSLRALFNGLQAQEAGNLEVICTSTGANLSTLTQGRVYLYVQRIRLNDGALRGILG